MPVPGDVKATGGTAGLSELIMKAPQLTLEKIMPLMKRLRPPPIVASSMSTGLAALPIPPNVTSLNVAISAFTTLLFELFTDPGTARAIQLLVLGQFWSCGAFVQVWLAANSDDAANSTVSMRTDFKMPLRDMIGPEQEGMCGLFITL